VQKNAAALTGELGKMLDDMIVKFTEAHEISPTLDESRTRGPTASATQRQHHRSLTHGKKATA